MQHRLETDVAETMASDLDIGLGCGGDSDGRDAEHGWLLRGSLHPRHDRKWTLPRRGVLLVNVVQTRGATLPHLALLQRRIAGGCIWRNFRMGE